MNRTNLTAVAILLCAGLAGCTTELRVADKTSEPNFFGVHDTRPAQTAEECYQADKDARAAARTTINRPANSNVVATAITIGLARGITGGIADSNLRNCLESVGASPTDIRAGQTASGTSATLNGYFTGGNGTVAANVGNPDRRGPGGGAGFSSF